MASPVRCSGKFDTWIFVIASFAAYCMTWSAPASTDCGIVRLRVLAALRLMISSNFVGCSTGRSAGLAAGASAATLC